ncbi:uncharacterized protein LOC121427860 [Lytechinus variegatus]|uniref:uncharacterized protein LOC121427860 n=1 Tax=Lytechinus variegatus TaxID=7654 RepID=UPI001BB2BA0D|nr:uncharacterized protein LOC121427860 [Lytechinus variegatus]
MDAMVATYVAYLVVCCFLGIPGNAIIIRVFTKKRPKMSTDILLITLAVIDLMSSVLLIVAIIWAVNPSFRTQFNCVFFWYFRRTFAIETGFMPSVIAIDRYIMVCSPFNWRTSKRKAVFWVVVTNSLCFTFSIPFILYGNAVGVVCTYNGPKIFHYFFLTLMNIIYLIVGISCPFCYLMIYRKIKRHFEETAYIQPSNRSAPVSTNDSGSTFVSQSQPRTENADDIPFVTPGKSHQQGSVSEQTDIHEVASRSRVAFSSDHLAIPSVSGSVDIPESSYTKCHHGAKNQVSPTPAAGPEPADPKAVPSLTSSKPRTKRDRMTKMMFIVTVIYVLTVMPAVILENLGEKYIKQMQQTTVGEMTVNFLVQMRIINHIINIFVYYGVNEHFRKDTNALFVSILSKLGHVGGK